MLPSYGPQDNLTLTRSNFIAWGQLKCTVFATSVNDVDEIYIKIGDECENP
jgi:hypothetical protein